MARYRSREQKAALRARETVAPAPREKCPRCDGDLIWPVHTPKRVGEVARRVPLDASPTDDVKAPYAVVFTGSRSRWLDPGDDVDVIEERHQSHVYTCPDRVTPDELYARPSKAGGRR